MIDDCREAASREQLKSDGLTDENTEALRKIDEIINRTAGEERRKPSGMKFS